MKKKDSPRYDKKRNTGTDVNSFESGSLGNVFLPNPIEAN